MLKYRPAVKVMVKESNFIPNKHIGKVDEAKFPVTGS
jgi:hypothetical protein